MPLGTTVTAPSRIDTFPTRGRVELAASVFPRERLPETSIDVSPLSAFDRTAAVELAGVEPATFSDRLLIEGPRFYVALSAGAIQLRTNDWARAERAAARAVEGRGRYVEMLAARALAGLEVVPAGGVSRVRVWTARSRARMLLRLHQLDYQAAGFAGRDGWRVGMVTLTYPGDWLAVAPGPDACRRHLAAFRRRFERRWGPLRAVWKREFQRRGAPHFHLVGLVPTHPEFVTWLGVTWAEVVGHADPDELAAHRVAGTGLDFKAGGFTGPSQVAGYLAKEGLAAAKGYQNTPPAEWDAQEGVGRFWGYWRLDVVRTEVEVAGDVHRFVGRTLRRWHRAQGHTRRVARWRKVHTVDRETGELGWKWRRRWTTVRVRRLQRGAGYLLARDAAGLGEQLASAATRATTVQLHRRMAGPAGYLP